MTQQTPTPEIDTEAEIRAEAHAKIEAAKRENLEALRAAVLQQLASATDDHEEP